jgi:hemolysin III
MFSCSAAYSMFDWCRHGDLLRRFDHAAIFAMIAGSYTPFTLLKISHHGWSIGLTTAVWIAAAIGIGFKLARATRSWAASIAFYLALGWLPLVAIIPLITAVEAFTLAMLVIGGLLYTVGVAFFAWKRLPFPEGDLARLAASSRRRVSLTAVGLIACFCFLGS